MARGSSLAPFRTSLRTENEYQGDYLVTPQTRTTKKTTQTTIPVHIINIIMLQKANQCGVFFVVVVEDRTSFFCTVELYIMYYKGVCVYVFMCINRSRAENHSELDTNNGSLRSGITGEGQNQSGKTTIEVNQRETRHVLTATCIHICTWT